MVDHELSLFVGRTRVKRNYISNVNVLGIILQFVIKDYIRCFFGKYSKND